MKEINVPVPTANDSFIPDPELAPDTIDHQRLFWATIGWHKNRAATESDYKRFLMGRKNRSKTLRYYIEWLGQKLCNLQDRDLVVETFESVVLNTWLKTESETNQTLRQEVCDEIHLQLFHYDQLPR